MKGLKIGIAVVLLLAAGIIFWKFSKTEDAPPADPGLNSLLMCSNKDCNHVFEMSPAQVKSAQLDARKSGNHEWLPTDCPTCKQKTAYLATKCDKCGTVFFGAEAPGGTGQCPKCRPDFKPPPKDEMEVPEEGGPPRPKPKVI